MKEKNNYGPDREIVGCLKFHGGGAAAIFKRLYQNHFSNNSLNDIKDILYICSLSSVRNLKPEYLKLWRDEPFEPCPDPSDKTKFVLLDSNKERIDVDGREEAKERNNSGEKECVRQS